MGKSTKKSASKVDAPPAVVAPTKPMKKGKRVAEDAIEKQLVSAKKQKKDVEVEKKIEAKVQKKNVKKKVESSSEEDSSSEEELKVKVPAKKGGAVVKPPVKESSSSEEESSDDEPAKGKVAARNGVAKNNKQSSSSDDSSSDEDEVPKTKLPAAKNGTVESDSDDESSDSEDADALTKRSTAASKSSIVAVTKKKEKSDSDESSEDSDSEDESDSDEDVAATKKVTATVTKNAPAAASKKDKSSSDDESSEDDVPAAKNSSVAATKKDDSSEESESDSSDESDDEQPQKKKQKVPILATSNAVKPSVKATEEEDSSSEEESSGDDEPSKIQGSKKFTPASKDSSSEEGSTEEESEEEGEKPTLTPKKMDAGVKTTSLAPTKETPKTPATPIAQTTGSKTLFVGNLSYSVEQADVENFFKDAGEVVDVRFAMSEDNSFRGFGHVELATVEAAQKALRELNGKDLLGRPVKLDMAKERGSYTPSSGGNENSYQKGGRTPQGQTIFVRGFDKYDGEGKVRSAPEDHFGSCGEMTRVSIPKDQDGGVKGIAYIDFKESDAFNKALELDGSEFGESSLSVEEAKPRGDSAGGGRSGGRDSGGRFGGRRGGGRSGGGCFGGGGRGRGTPGKPSMFAADSINRKEMSVVIKTIDVKRKILGSSSNFKNLIKKVVRSNSMKNLIKPKKPRTPVDVIQETRAILLYLDAVVNTEGHKHYETTGLNLLMTNVVAGDKSTTVNNASWGISKEGVRAV